MRLRYTVTGFAAHVQGDVLVVAQLAGVSGAKLTSQLIPLCHSLNLRRV
jgi:molybdenum cofactor biosynthesis enzyme